MVDKIHVLKITNQTTGKITVFVYSTEESELTPLPGLLVFLGS